MKPKNTQINSGCPEALSSNCVVWTGPEIPCLGVSHGDRVSEVVCGIANKVCNICKDIDVSQLDLSCLIDQCDCEGCPENRSVVTVLQCLLDNQCKLQELIGVGGDGDCCQITVNMKCLKKFDDFGNEIPQDLNAALQSIINEVCTHRTTLVFLQEQIDDLQEQIDNIVIPPPYDEPEIVTCLTPVPTPTSDVVPIVAQDYCDYKALNGTEAQITQAISQQCPGLDTLLILEPNWILNPSTGAQSLNNLWIAYCNLLNRVTTIEENCCKVTCKDVLVGFTAVFNEDNDGVILTFSEFAGTSIPNGFTDLGSIITITDIAGNAIQFTTTAPDLIANNAVIEIITTGLLTTGDFNINVQANIGNGSLTCSKCVNKTIMRDPCKFCILTATDTVTIIYKICPTATT